MEMRYVYWQEEDMWLGHLEEYPGLLDAGRKPKLEENLRDLVKN